MIFYFFEKYEKFIQVRCVLLNITKLVSSCKSYINNY